jgi:hypothetical protein
LGGRRVDTVKKLGEKGFCKIKDEFLYIIFDS